MSKIKSLVQGVMTIDPAAPAIEYNRRWYSWGELDHLVTAIDAVFAEHDVPTGARIGGLLRNCPEIACAIVSIITTDRCVVTLNPILPDDKLAPEIEALQTPVVIGLKQDWDRAEIYAAAKRAGVLGIQIDPEAHPMVSVILQQRKDATFRTDAADVAIEMLTSGTTGTPKRIPLKAKNFEQMILDAAHFEKRDPNAPPVLRRGVTILNTPFSHIGGLFGLFSWLSAGRQACMLDRFTVESFTDAVSRHKCKTASAPPSALRMILDAKVPREMLQSLMVFRTATAPLEPELAEEFFDTYGVPVLQNYGATEFAGGVAGWTLEDFKKFPTQKRGSVGSINPGIKARVVDAETGQEVALGSPGLLELQAKHLGDGKSWVRTTDIARLDEDNFLWILGRADNAIIRGGFKVMPDDVVRAIESHPAVLEACVVALPDPRLGQIPVAGYIVRSGHTLEADELRTYLREVLAPYQVPVHLKPIREFPRTPSMKVSHVEFKKLFEDA
jgi:long-chain acyl-CoA synthetase